MCGRFTLTADLKKIAERFGSVGLGERRTTESAAWGHAAYNGKGDGADGSSVTRIEFRSYPD
jgi:hypothetical protein